MIIKNYEFEEYLSRIYQYLASEWTFSYLKIKYPKCEKSRQNIINFYESRKNSSRINLAHVNTYNELLRK